MNGKSLIMLGLAILCGLGAMYGTSRMMTKDRGKSMQETQDVLVAVRDLKIEELLKPDMVKVVQMPRANLPPGTFTSYKDVEDRWVQIKTLEDEPIVDRKLAPKGSPAGIIARIPDGMRAFAVEVNEQSGVSGFILPDHRVDVVHTDVSPNGKSEAETILQDVLVLASGTVFTRPEDRSIQSHTVTLAVTPDQVDILVGAKARGALTLALRGINDRKPVPSHKPKPEPPPIEVALAKPVEPAPAMPPPPPPPVPLPPEEPKPVVMSAPESNRARYVTIYRGIDNSKRVRLDAPGMDEDMTGPETTASLAFPALEKN
jgi:pilus assembly protein CpaB